MSRTSSLLRYLPSVTYAEPPGGSVPSLNDLLLIFEKLLVGRDDGIRVEHQAPDDTSPHGHEGLQAVIGRIQDLLSPWKTPAELLPMLASWLALELPDFWNEYQRRKIISEIAEIYRLRGTKAGLQRFLELHVVGKSRPRIVIDDGSRLLVCRPEQHTLAPIHTSLSQAAFDLGESQGSHVQPRCAAATPAGDLYVGGYFYSTDKDGIRSKHPCVSIIASGTHHAGERWQPAGESNGAGIVALAVHNIQPPSIYALASDLAGNMVRYQLGAEHKYEYVLADLGIVGFEPRDMVVSPSDEILILMQSTTKADEIVLLRQSIDDKDNITGLALTSNDQTRPLSTSLSLTVLGNPNDNWSILVGSAGKSNTTEPAQIFEFKVDSSEKKKELKGKPLSFAVPSNPLVAPISLAPLSMDTLYVLDAGLKPYQPDQGYPLLSNIARPPAIYKLSRNPATDRWQVHQASRSDTLVYPTDMTIHDQVLYVCDPGLGPELGQDLPEIGSAIAPHEFRVVVHFPRPSLDLVANDIQLDDAEKQTLENIRAIVAAERPAHTICTIVSQDLRT